jgi:hypothetical protein
VFTQEELLLLTAGGAPIATTLTVSILGPKVSFAAAKVELKKLIFTIYFLPM